MKKILIILSFSCLLISCSSIKENKYEKIVTYENIIENIYKNPIVIEKLSNNEIKNFISAINDNKEKLFSNDLYEFDTSRVISTFVDNELTSYDQIKAISKFSKFNIGTFGTWKLTWMLKERGIISAKEIDKFENAINDNKEQLFKYSKDRSDRSMV